MEISNVASTSVSISTEERTLAWEKFVQNNPEFAKQITTTDYMNATCFVSKVRYKGENAIISVTAKLGRDGVLLPKTISKDLTVPKQLVVFDFDHDNSAYTFSEVEEGIYTIKQDSYEKGMTCLGFHGDIRVTYTVGETTYTIKDEFGSETTKTFNASQQVTGFAFSDDKLVIAELGNQPIKLIFGKLPSIA